MADNKIAIFKSSIPPAGIQSIRSLKYGAYMEHMIAPELGAAMKDWMKGVAKNVAADWPRRSGKSRIVIENSPQVNYSDTLSSIHGAFLVTSVVASNEFGTKVRVPRTAEKIAIPVYYGLFPDGRPKRLGPKSWSYLRTFCYRSKTTGQLYLAYKTKAEGVKIIYILVDTAGKLQPLSKFRKQWDAAIPALQGVIGEILSSAVADVYNQQFMDVLNSIDGALKMNRLPSVIPKTSTRIENLTPRLDK